MTSAVIHVCSGAGGRGSESSLHEALDQARRDGGGTVCVGPGRFEVFDSELRIGPNTSLHLSPATELVRTGRLRTLLSNAPLGDDRVTGDYDGPGNITIDGGIWDANGYDNDYNAFGMVFDHARDVSVRNLEIRNTPLYHAIETNSTYNVEIVGCRFINGIARPNNPWETEAVSLDLAAPNLVAWGAGDYTHAQHVRILNNYCENFPTFAGCHTGHPQREFANVVISQNTAVGISEWAVNLTNVSHAVISSNVFTDVANGIRVRGGTLPDGRPPTRNIAISANVIACRSGGSPITVGTAEETPIDTVAISGNVLAGDVGETITCQPGVSGLVTHGNCP